MEDFKQSIAVDVYSCKLTDHEESGEPAYQLVMEKVSMPGGKCYTRLLLKFKNGQGEVNLPLAAYSDYEYYPLQDPNVDMDSQVVASDTRLYIKKGSTPTNLTLLVFGIASKLSVDSKRENDLNAHHTITFTRESDAATITFKNQSKYIGKSTVNRYVQTGEYKRLEAVCKSKIG